MASVPLDTMRASFFVSYELMSTVSHLKLRLPFPFGSSQVARVSGIALVPSPPLRLRRTYSPEGSSGSIAGSLIDSLMVQLLAIAVKLSTNDMILENFIVMV